MTTAQEDFVATFNKNLGNRIGRPLKNFTLEDAAKLSPGAAASAIMLNRIGRGAKKSGSSGTKKPKSAKITPEMAAAQNAQILAKSHLDTLKGHSVLDQLKDIGSGALDLLSRSEGTVAGAFVHAQKAMNEGEPIWSVADDFLYGARRGITGKEHQSGGDIVSAARHGINEGVKPGFGFGTTQGYKILRDSLPKGWRENADRALGGVLTVTTDPLTYATGGTKAILSGSEKAVAKSLAKTAAEDLAAKGASKVVQKEARKAVMETAYKNRLTGKAAAEQAVRDAVHTGLADSRVAGKTVRVANTMSNERVGVEKLLADKVWEGAKATPVEGEAQKFIGGADNMFAEVSGGAKEGKLIGAGENTGSIANKTAQAYVDHMMEGLQKNIDRFNALQRRGLSSNDIRAQLSKLTADDPEFAKYMELRLGQGGANGIEALSHEMAMIEVEKDFAGEAKKIIDATANHLNTAIKRVPTVKFMGKEIHSFDKLARPIPMGLKDLGGITKAISYSHQFPGFAQNSIRKAKDIGLDSYDRALEAATKLAHGTTKAEREIIQKALWHEASVGPKLDPIVQSLKDLHINHIDELNALHGVDQTVTHELRRNLPYTQYNGPPDAVSKFFIARDIALKKMHEVNVAADKLLPVTDQLGTKLTPLQRSEMMRNFGDEAATAMGLKPEKDSFHNFIGRKVAHQGKLTKRLLQSDLMKNWGIKAKLSEDTATLRHLSEVKGKHMTPQLLKDLGVVEGDKLYLPEMQAKFLHGYIELMKPGSAESKELFKLYDKGLNMFKSMNTKYFPMFHAKNFMGDMAVGVIDGVTMKDYYDVLRMGSKMKLDGLKDVYVAGQKINGRFFFEKFKLYAGSGGQISTESGIKTIRGMKTPASVITHLSNRREDFGRFVHFYSAMKKELPGALRKNKNIDQAWEDAFKIASYRVNKYKFDFGALTRMEQKGMKRLIPFYSYSRKAIPILAESLLVNPKFATLSNKLRTSMLPNGSDSFDPIGIPQRFRDSGFGEIIGGANPIGITGSALPIQSAFETFSKPFSQFTPPLKIFAEAQTGKNAFTNQPMGGPLSYITSEMRPLSTLKNLTSMAEKGKNPAVEMAKLIGLPVDQITTKGINQQMTALTFQLIGELKKYDTQAQARGYHIYLSKGNAGTSIDVKNLANNNVVKFPSLPAAVNYLQSLK